mgnify:CR=1 FL=1
MGVWEARSDFEGLSGGESGGIGINGDFMQFWATGDLFQSFMFSDEDGGQGIENDIEQDLMYAEDPILYLKSIIDFCNKKIEKIGKDADGIDLSTLRGKLGMKHKFHVVQ